MRELNVPVEAGYRVTTSRDEELPEPLPASFIGVLFSLFLAATVIPIFSLPGLGLSFTAPLMFLIGLEVLAGRRTSVGQVAKKRWLGPLMFLAYGMLLAVFANLLFKQAAMGTDVIITLIRYGYWWLVFLIIANISSHRIWMRRIIIMLGVSVIGLAMVRVLDAALVGGWGLHIHELRPRFLSKNLYGIQFSSFSPFAFILPFVVNRRHRLFVLLAVFFLLVVILANGSRGNWVALLAGGSVGIAVYSISHSVRRQWVWILPLLVFIIVLQLPLPGQIGNIVNYQTDTFENLDADKAYQFRQVMVQKGLLLLKKNPVFGVGLNEFKNTYVPELVIPPLLQKHASTFTRSSSHNSYVIYLAELGLVGTLPFVLFLARLLFQGTRVAIHLTRREEVWVLGVLWSFVSMSAHLWSLAGLGSTGTWLVYGLVAGMIEQNRSHQVQEHQV